MLIIKKITNLTPNKFNSLLTERWYFFHKQRIKYLYFLYVKHQSNTPLKYDGNLFK